MKGLLILTFVGLGALLAGQADLPASPPKQPTGVTIIDGSGKELKLTSWRFTAGTKHMSWLAAAGEVEAKTVVKEQDKGKGGKKGTAPKTSAPAVGPEALEFTEGNDLKVAPLKKAVLSYIPVASIRSIDFQSKKDFVTVRVVKSDKEIDDEILYGLTGYAGTNIIAIEATTDLGELGKSTVEFKRGGKGRGLQAIRFASPKPIDPLPASRVATVKQAAKGQPAFAVVDLQGLYSTAGGLLRQSPTLFFKDTIKLDMPKIQTLSTAGTSGVDFNVTLMGKQDVLPLELIDRPKMDGKTDMQLVGLIGRFGGGYRVFPMNSIGEIMFTEKK
jgi:hypothetical protein